MHMRHSSASLSSLLPATTFAFDVSYSAPTQCNSFQTAWDDSHFLYKLLILPLALDDRPVNLDRSSLLAPLHDSQTKTPNYTLNVLPFKSGAQFVLAMDYAFSPPDTRIKIAHKIWSIIAAGAGAGGVLIYILDPNSGRLVEFELPVYRSRVTLEQQPSTKVSCICGFHLPCILGFFTLRL